jgi:hypothetical protein
MQNLTVNEDDTQSCQGTDVGNIQDVSIGEFGTAKLLLEAEGLFIKVYKIRFKFMKNYCGKSTYLNFQTKLKCTEM